LAPVVHGLEAKWQEEIDFVYLDIDDPRTDSFKRELGYRVQPHLFLVNEAGTVIHQWLGYVEAEELETAFNEALQ
jgi:hypothetical protein